MEEYSIYSPFSSAHVFSTEHLEQLFPWRINIYQLMINCSQHSNESRNINRTIKNMHRNTTKIKQDFTLILVLEVFIVTHLYKDISHWYVASNYVFFSFARFRHNDTSQLPELSWIGSSLQECPAFWPSPSVPSPPVKMFNRK